MHPTAWFGNFWLHATQRIVGGVDCFLRLRDFGIL